MWERMPDAGSGDSPRGPCQGPCSSFDARAGSFRRMVTGGRTPRVRPATRPSPDGPRPLSGRRPTAVRPVTLTVLRLTVRLTWCSVVGTILDRPERCVFA
nr:hypothetical protein KPHV_34100 [Kitasatospora purpeofusca]